MTKRAERAVQYKCAWRCGDPRCPMAMPVPHARLAALGKKVRRR